MHRGWFEIRLTGSCKELACTTQGEKRFSRPVPWDGSIQAHEQDGRNGVSAAKGRGGVNVVRSPLRW